MAIDVGQLYRSIYDLTDASGQPVNATTITLTITTYDAAGVAVPTTPSVTNPPAVTGHYLYDHPIAAAGLHKFGWTSATPTSAKTNWVWAGQHVSILSIEEARAHLNEQSTLQDEEIRSFMECATAVVENIVGPCVPRSVTQRVRTGCYQLLLTQFPVLSVTSVTSVRYPSSTWLTAALDVDKDAGVVSLLSGAPFFNGPWNVVYTAGRPNTIGPNVRQAAKEMLWHLWTTQRGALADSTTPDLLDVAQFESSAGFGQSFTVPHRVLELLEPDRIPGFA